MRVIVIGGGVIGYCSAYYLQQSGHDVTILDRNNTQLSPSYWNAGMVVPSHFIPLAAPGVVKKGLKWMFSNSSPFRIKMMWNRSFFEWVWQFNRHANQRHVDRSVGVLKDLNLTSHELFDEMIATLGLQKKKSGLVMVCQTEKGRREEEATARMANQLGIKAEVLSSVELDQLDPTVTYQSKGAVYYPGDAFMSPSHFMEALEEVLIKKGVSILKGQQVEEFEVGNETLEGVRTSSDYFEADQFVLSAGTFSDTLATKLGLKLLLQGGKGYSVTLAYPPQLPTYSSILTEAKVAITPMGNALRLAGTMEIVGKDVTVNRTRVNGYLKSVSQAMPAFELASMVEEPVWAGLRPCSPDGLPYIGRTKKWKNLVVSTGHSMMGFSLGPVSGKLVNQLVNNERPEVDVHLLSPDRYE